MTAPPAHHIGSGHHGAAGLIWACAVVQAAKAAERASAGAAPPVARDRPGAVELAFAVPGFSSRLISRLRAIFRGPGRADEMHGAHGDCFPWGCDHHHGGVNRTKG